MNTSEDSSFFLFPLVFFFFFSWIPSPIAFLFLLQSFFSSSSCPVISQIQGGYLSHQHLPLPFFDHENGLLGMQANYSAFNVAALGEESLKCRGDCYIGLCIFLYVFLRKVGKKGDPLLSKWLLLNQATCSSRRQVSRIISVMGPIDLLSMEGLFIPSQPLGRTHFTDRVSWDSLLKSRSSEKIFRSTSPQWGSFKIFNLSFFFFFSMIIF